MAHGNYILLDSQGSGLSLILVPVAQDPSNRAFSSYFRDPVWHRIDPRERTGLEAAPCFHPQSLSIQ